ncbi:helix-turn-helix domain-containing protein [Sphingobium sp. H39-3-25]|uniref:winged helix-turn-helix transcriptional regulator n=1 Tax=Sphingobium arseniciresistens TaxID=3030834 RepID=UPI0023B978D2|nr:helix-turn-helix domain-containing protein [Sphingobium arseniciresistens]
MQDGTFSLPGHFRETSAHETSTRGDVFAANCPTRQLLDRIADKWSTLILLILDGEPMRFNGLKRRIEGISQKMLSQTLKALERDGLVSRVAEATVPVTVTYSITPLGRALVISLQAMIDWAETRMGEVEAAQRAYDARSGSAH